MKKVIYTISSMLDADAKTVEVENLPEKMQFINKVKIPDEYKLTNSYNVYTRDINSDNRDYNMISFNILQNNEEAKVSNYIGLK